jgi:hypothetical protein
MYNLKHVVELELLASTCRRPTPAIESESESDSDPEQSSNQEPNTEDENDGEFAAATGDLYEPNTYKQAMKSPDAAGSSRGGD